MAAREDDITMFNLRFTKEMALWRNFSEVIFKWSPPGQPLSPRGDCTRRMKNRPCCAAEAA